MITHSRSTCVSFWSFSSLAVAVALTAFSSGSAVAQLAPSAGLGKGVNFGNMLEAPYEGAWGLVVEPEFFTRVVEAGFDHIRIPVDWTMHAQTEAPFTVDQEFFERIDEVLAMAEATGLQIIMNDHYHEELHEDPVAERPRFLAIWEQIATRYANKGDWLLFEILNEPHGTFTEHPELWNAIYMETLDLIRETNPIRKIVIGPVNFNSFRNLDQLELPNDPNLIASFHYYEPFEFTHQGAPWVSPLPPLGVSWRPFFKVLANPWQRFLWNTTVDSTGSGLRVTYDEGYAGFGVHTETPIVDPQAIQFRVNRPFRLQVLLFDGDGFIEYPIQSTATPGDEKMYTVNFDNLPPGFELQTVAIQNYTPEPQSPMIVSVLRLKQNDEWSYIMTTRTNVQRLDFRVARDWAIENNIPLHLGEFGALQTGALRDRIPWTRSVRINASVLGIDWAYWELAAFNFGIYDPVNHVWRIDLAKSLLPSLRQIQPTTDED